MLVVFALHFESFFGLLVLFFDGFGVFNHVRVGRFDDRALPRRTASVIVHQFEFRIYTHLFCMTKPYEY